MSKHIQKLYLGFLQMHILHHASMDAIYGSWMIEELREHGYLVGPSHIYPLLGSMTKDGLLRMQERLIEGKIRKYYHITDLGTITLTDLVSKLKELTKEILQ